MKENISFSIDVGQSYKIVLSGKMYLTLPKSQELVPQLATLTFTLLLDLEFLIITSLLTPIILHLHLNLVVTLRDRKGLAEEKKKKNPVEKVR